MSYLIAVLPNRTQAEAASSDNSPLGQKRFSGSLFKVKFSKDLGHSIRSESQQKVVGELGSTP
ncbi:hypothetical protein [Coleofasciculus sp.]|uniref:hypothetical protein n=1 Tax=Coleofasciculus sp. TaxID=3100458 RepID=UPI0039F7A094